MYSPLTYRDRPCATCLSILAVFTLLSGCGGGGGNQPTCIDTVQGCLESEAYRLAVQDVAEEIRPSFGNQWAPAIKLAEAWGHLRIVDSSEQPGQGVNVGVMDTGIDLEHPVFVEGVAAGDVTEHLRPDSIDEIGDEYSHGTAVASVIAGRRNPEYPYQFTGIVPHARLRMFAIALGDSPAPDFAVSSITLSELASFDQSDASEYREIFSHDLDVLNLSFGYIGPINHYSDEAALRDSIGQTIRSLAQTDREDKTILVWAAGNSHGQLCRPGTGSCVGDSETDDMGRPAGEMDAASPNIFAGMMARIEELRGHSVATVAVDQEGEITDFSNRCGIAADWCIAAPGDRVEVAYFGSYGDEIGIRGFVNSSGTSFSAPMVTGGLALLKQFFRDQLSSEELVTRLFETANNTGRYADHSIYGNGLMDLDAALSPHGEPTIISGVDMTEAGIPLQGSSLQLGTAFGDGPATVLSRQKIAAFDTLGAPFWYDLGRMVTTPGLPLLDTQLHDFMAPLPLNRQEKLAEWNGNVVLGEIQFNMRKTPARTGDGHTALPYDAIALTTRQSRNISTTAFTTEGFQEDSRPISGTSILWHPSHIPFGLRAGWLNERSSILASTGEGAFGKLAADSVFIGLDLSTEAGSWQLEGGPEIGLVRPDAQGGIITALAPLTTSAFALHASRSMAESGSLRVSLTQPLRVEDGDAMLSFPTGRTRDGIVLRRQLRADLAPSGRQVDLSVRWERPVSFGTFRLGTVATHHAGHDAEAPHRLALLVGWHALF